MYAPQRKYISKTIDEWLNPQPEEKRTGEEIVNEVLNKTGIKLTE